MTRARDNSFNPFNNQAAGKNYLINGAFDFWQRGTTFSVGGYTADRWNVDNGTTTRQTGTGQFPYCLQIANASGNPALRQGFELPFAGNAGQFQVGTTWTASFYAKTSTSIGSQLAFYVAFNDGVNTGSNAVQIASSTTVGASSTSWTKYTYTFTVASSPVVTNTALMVVPYLNSGAYAGNFSIAQVQLELGSSATQFSRAGGTIGGELSLCQRYYEKSFPVDVTPANGLFYAGGLAEIMYSDLWALEGLTIPFKVPKRITPSINFFGATSGTVGGWQQWTSNAWVTWASVSSPGRGQQISTNQFSVQIHNNGSSGFGVGTVKAIQGDWVASAEL